MATSQPWTSPRLVKGTTITWETRGARGQQLLGKAGNVTCDDSWT